MSTRDTPRNTTSLPTREEVLAWQEELAREESSFAEMKARHAAEEKALRDRCAKLAKLVEYGLALADMNALPEAVAVLHPQAKHEKENGVSSKPRVRSGRKGGKSWTATLRRIVVKADRGLPYSEAKALMSETHLGETLKRTDKAFYGAIGKLAARGDIVRHNGMLFSPKSFTQYRADVDAGRIKDIPATNVSRSGESPNEVFLERFMSDRPDGAESAEIVHALLNDPPADLPGTTKNKNSIYNLLARWCEKGKLIRRDGRYYLVDRPQDDKKNLLPHEGNGSMQLSGERMTQIGKTPDAPTSGVLLN